MTAEITIKQSYRIRRVAGAALIFITLPLVLIFGRFHVPDLEGWAEIRTDPVVLSLAALLAFGLLGAFPLRKPRPRITINDRALVLHHPEKIIPLKQIISIRIHMPFLAKYYQLTFTTATDATDFPVIHLTHDVDEIFDLIAQRFALQGRFLHQTRSPVLGALTGIWEVKQNPPAKPAP